VRLALLGLGPLNNLALAQEHVSFLLKTDPRSTQTLRLVKAIEEQKRRQSEKQVTASRPAIVVPKVKTSRPKRIVGAVSLVVLLILLGVNVQQAMISLGAGGNIFMSIILGVVFVLDNVLTYIGPLLFFWGSPKSSSKAPYFLEHCRPAW
jgi:hypothetical protein